MNPLRLLSLSAARSWDRAATRFRLRELPALPAMVAVLALGLGIPLAAEVKTTPPALTESLAKQRLERFLARHTPPADSARPAGRIVDARPRLSWPKITGAKTYSVALIDDGARVLARRTGLVDRWATLPNELRLEPGTYVIKVSGMDGARVAGYIESSFEVLAALPQGYLITPRPACRWLPVPGAARYRVQLRSGDGQLVVARDTVDPELRIRAPGMLSPAEYRLEAVGIDASGEELPYPRVTTFVVRAAPKGDEELDRAAQLELNAREGDLVRAGYYAAHGSPYDVYAALSAYVEGAPDGDEAALARRILALFGER